jgi:hypothetical protein
MGGWRILVIGSQCAAYGHLRPTGGHDFNDFQAQAQRMTSACTPAEMRQP